MLSPKVRTFIVLVDVNGSHPNLMPDLSASLDVTLARTPHAIVVPRDALRQDGDQALVRVQRGGGFEDGRLPSAHSIAHEAVVASGLDEGSVIARTYRLAGGYDNGASSRAVLRAATKPGDCGRADQHPRGRRVRRRRAVLRSPDLPTALVTKGEFVDTLEIRGEIRPLKSIVLSSPMQSGELQILKLAKNGSMVKAGDVVVQFDGTTLQRTIQEKQSELKQAERRDRAGPAQARIATSRTPPR